MQVAQKHKIDMTDVIVPQHVAIIMDGNGRWARQRGLPRQAGHRAGAETCDALSMLPSSSASKS